MAEPEEPLTRISDQQIQTVCMMVLAGVAGVYLVYWLRPVLVPFVVACFIVSGVGPILNYLEERFQVSRVVAAGIAFLLGVALMAIFGMTISFSIMDLAKNKDQYRNRVRQLVNEVDRRLSFDLLNFKKLSPKKVTSDLDELEDTLGREKPAEVETAGGRRLQATTKSETAKAPVDVARDDPDTDGVADGVADTDTDGVTDGVADTDGVDESDQESDDANSDSNPPAVDAPAADAPAIAASPLAKSKPVQVRRQGDPVETERIKEATELVDAFVRDGISVVLQSFINLVSTSVVVLIYVFFLLLGKTAHIQTGTLKEIDSQIRGYLSLKTVISIGTGAVFGLTLRLFGVPMALSFGVLAFLLNFIPNIGPIVASLLPIPLILLDPSGNILWMVSVIAATTTVQLISGNVVEPKLMGNSSDLHPVTILLGLMFWGMMWGIIGMFLATPITAAIKIVLERFEPTQKIANIMAGRWDESGQGASPQVQANG